MIMLKVQKLKVQRWSRRRGFTLIETGATILVMSLLGVTVAPTLHKARSVSQGVSSAANLQSIGQGAGAYGFFNRGKLFTYSWRAGESYLLPDGRVYSQDTDVQAQQRQNQEILMRRTGRIQGISKMLTFSGRLPHRRSVHLVLLDYLDEPFEGSRFIDPADENQLYWAENPLEYLEPGNSLPYGNGDPGPGYDSDPNWELRSVVQRWTFASSYFNMPDSWQPDFPNARYYPVANTPHLFTGSNDVDFRTGRFIDEVAFPSQKVWIAEEFDREQAGSPYFAYNQARVEKLMFDGSVNNWASGDANPSIVEEFGLRPWNQTYVPLDTFPIPLGGLGDESLINQRFRWTFRGLGGVDYGPAQAPRGPGIR